MRRGRSWSNKTQYVRHDEPLSVSHLSAAKAVRAASKASKMISTTSHLFDPQRMAKIPRFSLDEVIIGDALGKGVFNNVFEVKRINIESHKSALSSLDYPAPTTRTVDSLEDQMVGDNAEPPEEKILQIDARHFTISHCVRRKTGQARYAIKYLRPKIMNDASSFETGAADLITETMLLSSSIEHPNIIKIRGICDQGVCGFASTFEGGFFILLDLLEETLASRLKNWTVKDKKARRFSPKKSCDDKTKKKLAERLHCALDISAALAYLHSHSIVYRDLKPENIGFDCRGDVKIFDFGLAAELHSKEFMGDDLYELTGLTGSPRYMAPEVAKSQSYNLSADVYSFSILLWQLCSLKTPYKKMDLQDYSALVVHGSQRPPIDDSWSPPLRSLMMRGWNGNLNERPSMDCCYRTIRKELVLLRDGDARGLENTRRRSTYVSKENVKEESVAKSA